MLMLVPILAAAATMASASPAPVDLKLVCQGARDDRFFAEDATRREVRSALQDRWAAYRRPATIEIDINSTRGRIHLGERMIPGVNTGGRDGWWRLKDVSQQGNIITGAYQLNASNTQRVTVNRATGRVDIAGAGRYRGVCQQGRAMDIRRPHPF